MMAGTDYHSISNSKEYNKHTEKYTSLLTNYITQTESSNKTKNLLKIIFFAIIIAIMILLTVSFLGALFITFRFVYKMSIAKNTAAIPAESVASLITAVISSFLTMLVSLLKLPKIIAKYLFNPKEDENMATVISHIQKYDVDMYRIERDAEKEAMKKFENRAEGGQNNSVSESNESVGNPSDIAT